MADDVTVTDNPDRHRYEAHVNGALAGFADYQLATDLVVLTHTEVDASFEGQGIGSHREYADVLYGAPPSKVTD